MPSVSSLAAGLTGAGHNPPLPGGGGWREFLAFKKARFREAQNIAGEGLEGGGLRGDLDNFGEKAL